jgi:putative nucleotidyltransferase with HDIG domain/PAS domain S-box-containing protein
MRHISSHNLSTVGFGLGVVMILLVGGIATVDLRALIQSNAEVDETLIILHELDETLSLVTEVESGQRGYIITGEEKYLESYHKAISATTGITQHLRELRRLTRDNPNQQKRLDLLDSLLTKKLAFIQETINLRKNAGLEAAHSAVLTGKDIVTMDEIRRVLGEMDDEETALLQDWSQTASISLQNTVFTLTGGAGASLLLFILSFFIVTREVRQRQQAEAALRQLNEELDQRVEQRTAELASASERYIDTLDNILEGCQIIGFDWRYLYINSATARQAHRTREELLDHTMMEMYPGIEETEVFRNLRRCMEERISFHWDNEFTYPDGSTGWFELSLQPVPEGVFILSIDITERRLGEIRIRQQIEQLTALTNIDQAIISSFDLKVTLDVIISQVLSQLNVDAADMLILEPDGLTLSCAAGQGFRTPAIPSARMPMSESQPAWEHRLIYIENLESRPDPRLVTPPGISEAFVCYVGVPLIVKERVKGVLEIFHRSPLQPKQDWIDFLYSLAGQSTIAVDNAHLFEDLERSNLELSQAYDATIEGWSRALDLRDKETEGHTQRVTELTLELARAYGLPDSELQYIRWGALLHDIGKMGIPDNILLKPDKLTEEEWARMKKHPTFAYEMLLPIAYLKSSLDIPYCHHEKWDGTGYPRGLKGEDIPLSARLFSVVDVWDALRSDRPYRQGWTKEKTLEHIISLSGTHFDPTVVKYFLTILH